MGYATGKAFSVKISVPPDLEETLGIDEEIIPKPWDLLDPKKRHLAKPPSPVPADETLISCSFVSEVNESGSCEFKIPPTHPLYDAIVPIRTVVTISEIDNDVWFGRVLNISLDWNMIKTVECEGILSMANQTVITHEKYMGEGATYIGTYIEANIASIVFNPVPGEEWKSSMEKDDLKDLRESFVPTSIVGRTPYELLQEMFDSFGGFFYYKTMLVESMDSATGEIHEVLLPYILYYTQDELLKNVEDEDEDEHSIIPVIDQPIELGKNLLDFSYAIDGSEIASSIYPTGATVEVSVPRLDAGGEQIYMSSDGEIYVPPAPDEDGHVPERPEKYSIPVIDIVEQPLTLIMGVDDTVKEDENGVKPLRFIPINPEIFDNDMTELQKEKALQFASVISVDSFLEDDSVIFDVDITKHVSFEGAWSIDELRNKAEAFVKKHLNILANGEIKITINATDLRFLDSELPSLYIGRYVNVIDDKHGISGRHLVTKIEADVMKVQKRITLGFPPNNTLTDIINRENRRARESNKLRKLNSTKEITAKTSDILFIPA